MFASLAAVVMLPIYNIFFVTPAFTDFIAKNKELSLIRVASQMASELISADSKLTKDTLPNDFPTEVERFRKTFDLWKVKVYSPAGEKVYPSSPEDIGYLKKSEDFFHDIVTDGKARTLVWKKDRKYFDGENGEKILIETYVPIMSADNVVGIFEIYSDITNSIVNLDKLRSRYHAQLVIITVFLLLTILLSFYRAHRRITERVRIQEEKEKLIRELEEALSKVKKLSGFLPICASCKKIRDDKGYWNQIEEYIRIHSEAEFSHGICPECSKKLYPKFRKKKD